MTQEEREYIVMTNAILSGYDNCGTVETLKELIDEVVERNNKLLKGDLNENYF